MISLAKITDASGRTYSLVPAERVLAMDGDSAERMLRESIEDDGGRAVRELARTRGHDALDGDFGLAALARAIESGAILAIDIGEDSGPGNGVLGTEPVDWDDIPSLADLRDPDPDRGLGELPIPFRGDGPTVTPVWTEPGFVGPGGLEPTVERSHAVTEVVIDGYAEGAVVMRWGGMRERTDATAATTRAALRLALWNARGKHLAIAGHADPVGQDGANAALALERARSVQLFASGQLDAWAEHAAAHATALDVACALVACHRILGLGPAGIDDANKLDAGLVAVRQLGGRGPAGAVVVEDWLAFAELYEFDLARLMMTDRAGLAETRGAVSWIDPPTVAVGEAHPVELVERVDLVGPAALAHRRCSLLVFGADDEGPAAIAGGGHVVYDGTYRRTKLRVPGEVLVDIAVSTVKRDPIARGRAWISCGELGATEHTGGADGHIRFMTLAGDVIEVVAAFDADGRGTMVAAGTEVG